MALPSFIQQRSAAIFTTVDMHTVGEPTRIVITGSPDIQGTLLQQRALAKAHHDHVRRALICEPRGHHDMYGALLRLNTELTESGNADIGVLFLTNDGYSTMCGHATLALGRLLVDRAGCPAPDQSIPNVANLRERIRPGSDGDEVEIRLHAPCGLVRVVVPVVVQPVDSFRTDPRRHISYLSVPSFVSGVDISIPIPKDLRWPELPPLQHGVTADVAYGGAFFLILPPTALGFSSSLAKPDLRALENATKSLQAAFNASVELRTKYLAHPDSVDLQFLYSVILTDTSIGACAPGASGAETGLCYFSDTQLDRSPTGSGVQARVALALAKGERKFGEKWTYHSLVSNAHDGADGFLGQAVEECGVGDGRRGVIVKVSGQAYYTGSSTFIVEEGDHIGEGFWVGGS